MNTARQTPVVSPLSWKQALVFSILAVVAFELAYTFHAAGFLVAVYLWCLFQLTRLKTGRQAFYVGLSVGFIAYAPQLNFIWTIFGPAAIPLWLVLAIWIGIFLVLARLCRMHFGSLYSAPLIPFLWTGLEYFRSELYYLRFAWLNAGYVYSDNLGWLPLNQIGVYGMGFLLMAAASAFALLQPKPRLIVHIAFLASLGFITNLHEAENPLHSGPAGDLQVAGVQMEFPSEPEVLLSLNQLVMRNPEARLLVLSEYTFGNPVPERVKDWCKKNKRYLIVGGKEPVSESEYYNTAFVISPDGVIVFSQAKSVPIQFFKDGLPAKEQKLWDSPWGKIGICICYDLSYSRVTDRLIRLGAQALIVPTMDLVDWGRHQHELHARVAPVRAAEYGVPIFRLASSGISQCVSSTGHVLATAPMPGDEAMLSGTLHLDKPGSLPWDRVLAPLSVCVTGLTIIRLISLSISRKKISLPKTD